MRVGVHDFPPFLFAGVRQILAGTILISFLALIKKVPFPTRTNVLRQAVAGFFMITLGNGLVTWAEVYVPSGVAAVICSLMPVWVVIINLTVNRSEKTNIRIVLGVITGLIGILVVFLDELSDFGVPAYQLGIASIFLASLSWAVGTVFIKRSSDNSNTFFNVGLQMFFGGLWCLIASLAVDDLSNVHWTQNVYVSIGYLAIVGSAIAFAMYAYVLVHLPVTIASLYSYINPIVAVILGWLILGERLNFYIGIAIVITSFGIYLVNKGYQSRKPSALSPKA